MGKRSWKIRLGLPVPETGKPGIVLDRRMHFATKKTGRVELVFAKELWKCRILGSSQRNHAMMGGRLLKDEPI